MKTDFVMICPVTQLPCIQGCSRRAQPQLMQDPQPDGAGITRPCTVAGTAVDIVACVLPGALLLILAVAWYLRARGLA